MTTRKFIVAGIDGGPDGLRAAEFAAGLASDQGRGLRLVHAYQLTPIGISPMYPHDILSDVRKCGEASLDAAERRVRDQYPALVIDHHLVCANRAAALVDASKRAASVVVGRRATEGLARVLTGSTSSTVAGHASSPVISVPCSWNRAHDRRPVVVGADGSPQGRSAISHAFMEASRRGAELVALRVWEMPAQWQADVPVLDSNAGEWAERARLALAEDIAGWCEEYPEVVVTTVVERSPYAAEQLLNKSAHASLLVIGSRGHNVMPGVPLGFTARTVLAHARCPVAVIHPGQLVDAHDRVRVAANSAPPHG